MLAWLEAIVVPPSLAKLRIGDLARVLHIDMYVDMCIDIRIDMCTDMDRRDGRWEAIEGIGGPLG